jgi:xanthine dehydrogenase YagS FAD-binding subunit
MIDFTYEKAGDAASALHGIEGRPRAKFLGGGTNLVDLMRESIERPDHLVDVSGLSTAIEDTSDGGLRVGAAVSNTNLANDRRVKERYPVLSQAILNGASGQIRNMATLGGNLMQRTRCYYFYDTACRCNKRSPGAGCDAIDGLNRIHAILGASSSCIATHPSDLCVALVALEAVVHVEGPRARRDIPIEEFHRLPGETPHLDTNLRPDELITAVTIPPCDFSRRSLYSKVRDRSSFAFALVSVAAAIKLEGEAVGEVRIALGGVAHKPWRAHRAEQSLLSSPATRDRFERAAALELAPAVGYAHNVFKIELAKRAIVDTLEQLVKEKRS